MKSASHRRIRAFLGFLAVVFAVGLLVWRLGNISRHPQALPPVSNSGSVAPTPTPTASTPDSSPSTIPASPAATIPASPTPTISLSPALPPPDAPRPDNLIIPVLGVRPEQLRDTFSESRAEGRVHDAIDIPAPFGTPVVAAADGTIVKLFNSERGGTTVYQSSTDRKFIYYYAHLDRYAEGLTEGHFAKQGETIAYVGDSGNAGPGNYHLHFSISLVSDPKRYWEGVNINPYPLLRR